MEAKRSGKEGYGSTGSGVSSPPVSCGALVGSIVEAVLVVLVVVVVREVVVVGELVSVTGSVAAGFRPGHDRGTNRAASKKTAMRMMSPVRSFFTTDPP